MIVRVFLFIFVACASAWADVAIARLFAESDNEQLIQFIDENRADLNTLFPRNGSGFIHYAVLRPDTVVLRYLLENGADANLSSKLGKTALFSAAVTGDIDAAKLLLKHGCNPSIRDNAPRHTAFEKAFISYYARGKDPKILAVMQILLPITNLEHLEFTKFATQYRKSEGIVAETPEDWLHTEIHRVDGN